MCTNDVITKIIYVKEETNKRDTSNPPVIICMKITCKVFIAVNTISVDRLCIRCNNSGK